MNDIKKENVILFRFADDVITISNEHFQKNIRNIYAADLELEKEIQINKNAISLDWSINPFFLMFSGESKGNKRKKVIKIQNCRSQTKLFGKGDKLY